MKAAFRLIGFIVLSALVLQLYFVAHIALMAAVKPESTAFQRSEIYRLGTATGSLKWRQQWVSYQQISDHLKSAVIASEDASFVDHDGVDIEALEKAWDKNSRAEQRTQLPASRFAAGKATAAKTTAKPVKIIGGSTITQQLAKNFFLSPKKTLWRKLREVELALFLELRYSKKQILEMYLNKIYFGQEGPRGIYGIEEAAGFYFSKQAKDISL
jgi:monofunctional biosynthetic peptidoglycan transglycosylase